MLPTFSRYTYEYTTGLVNVIKQLINKRKTLSNCRLQFVDFFLNDTDAPFPTLVIDDEIIQQQDSEMFPGCEFKQHFELDFHVSKT